MISRRRIATWAPPTRVVRHAWTVSQGYENRAFVLYNARMTAEAFGAVPEEISVSDARPILGELAEAAAAGKVIHLTKHGRRIAAIVPERSQAEVNEAFIATGRRIADRYRDMFDRLAEL